LFVIVELVRLFDLPLGSESPVHWQAPDRNHFIVNTQEKL
jgi:hypothetical protein